MILGATGTRFGMTAHQKDTLRRFLREHAVEMFHHGSCQGADVEAARIVREAEPTCWIVAHPGPTDHPCHAVSGVDDETCEPTSHFARNRLIVNESECLIGFPFRMIRENKGGTWYTIVYAEKKNKPVVIAWPTLDSVTP